MKKKVQFIMEKEMNKEEIENEKKNLIEKGYIISKNLYESGRMYSDFLEEEYRKLTQWFLEDVITCWFHREKIELGGDLKLEIETSISKYDGGILIKNIRFENKAVEKELIQKTGTRDLSALLNIVKNGIDEESVYENKNWLIKKQIILKKKTEKDYANITGIDKIDLPNLSKIISNWGGDYQVFSEIRKGVLTLILQPTEKYSEETRSVFLFISEKDGTIETLTLGKVNSNKIKNLKEKIVQEIKENQLKNLF